MNPAKMKDKINIQQRTSQKNSYGESTEVWVGVAVVWAEVHSLRGFERTESYLADARAGWRVVIRTRPGITSAMRVVTRGMILEIKSALPIGATAFTELICEANA
ncbi:phage head closure protein [Deefgea rivuli]|uniref:phage head closure protein n=1 Tax=Deefgea rivuli TaxID=400948 RepID=UPI000485289C|nr:phage head closure protein [Deefgea rivuli]